MTQQWHEHLDDNASTVCTYQRPLTLYPILESSKRLLMLVSVALLSSGSPTI